FMPTSTRCYSPIWLGNILSVVLRQLCQSFVQPIDIPIQECDPLLLAYRDRVQPGPICPGIVPHVSSFRPGDYQPISVRASLMAQRKCTVDVFWIPIALVERFKCLFVSIFVVCFLGFAGQIVPRLRVGKGL